MGRPLFRSTLWKTRQLTGNALTTKVICELITRRLKDAGLPKRLSPHSFRVAAITDLLKQGAKLEDAVPRRAHRAQDDRALRPAAEAGHAGDCREDFGVNTVNKPL
jgi:integrase